MPTITVHRIAVTPVEVEVSEICPRCGADLRDRNQLSVMEYGTRWYRGRLPGPCEAAPASEDDSHGVLLNFDRGYDDGDGSLPVELVECRCGFTLANGDTAAPVAPVVADA